MYLLDSAMIGFTKALMSHESGEELGKLVSLHKADVEEKIKLCCNADMEQYRKALQHGEMVAKCRMEADARAQDLKDRVDSASGVRYYGGCEDLLEEKVKGILDVIKTPHHSVTIRENVMLDHCSRCDYLGDLTMSAAEKLLPTADTYRAW